MATQRDVLHVNLFGGFSLDYDGHQLPPLASRHARLLFAWLVLQGGRPQPRTLLCHRFWPDVAEPRARRRLSHALWQVQDAFGEGDPQRPYLLTPGDQVQFDASAPYWLDVEEFEQRLDEVDRAGRTDSAAVRHLRRCVELYQGDLLAGSYEDWVLDEQDRLRQRHVTALSRLVDACKQRGNFEEALAVARRLTHQAPLREEAHREVMRLCVLLGQTSQALEQFERCRSVLAEELQTEPSAATAELHDRIARSRNVETPLRTPIEELAADRLVGRDDERVVLVDQLERTLAGTAGTVFLEGEPGVGKTHLLAQTAEDARWRGFAVLWGSCSGPDVPYAALRHAVLPELDPVRVAQLRALVAPVWLREAGRLLPPLVEGDSTDRADPTATAPDLVGGDAAERMRQALTEVLVGLTTIDPVLVVLEDLHRADHETLAVLRTLSRHPDPGRLVVLLSYRDVDAREDPRVWPVLRELDRDARPVRLALEPLTAFETGSLLREVLGAAQLPAGFVEAVHRECGGNPLYVLELLRSLRDTGALQHDTDHLDSLEVPVTAGLRTLISGRLELLGDAAAAVAEFGAVLGTSFHLPTVEIGLGMAPRQLSAAIGELVRRNLVQPEGGAWRFSHAATRRVLLDRLSGDRARDLHAVAADALATTHPDEIEALATHLLEAGEARRALPHLREAADRATALHAYATAAHHLEAAVAVLDQVLLPVEDRIALLLQAEGVMDVLGRRDLQGQLLDRLERSAPDGGRLATEVRIRRATLLGHLDRLDEALAVAEDAAHGAATDQLRGRALTSVGELLHWQGGHDDAIAALRRATELLDDDTPSAVHARYVIAAALRTTQRFDAARDILEDALVSAREQGDEVGAARALGGLADIHAETGHTDDAVQRYRESVELARQIGFRHREGVSLVNLGTLRLSRGEPARALAVFDEAEHVFRGLGNRRGVMMVQLNRAWLLHRWLGRDRDAERDAREAQEFARTIGSGGLEATALETLAGIARRNGDATTAARHLETGLRAARAAHDRRAEVQLRRGIAELAAARGEHAEVASVAAAAAESARSLDMLEFVADLASLAAIASAAAGDARAAASWAAVARAHLATAGEPHRVHHRLARVAETEGEGARAATHHRAAWEHLDRHLDGLDPSSRAAAEEVDEHRRIVEHGVAHTPRRLELRVARADAPTGRALTPDETVLVELDLAPLPSSPAARRAQLLQVLGHIDSHGAAATVDDLTTIFDVSASTVRRDIRTLRQEGHDATTRGSETG